MSVAAESGARSAPASRAWLFAKAVSLDVPQLAVFAAFVAEPSTRDFALVNAGVQVLMFAFGACLPAYRRRVMAFTDCIWPWGLAAIGTQALLFGDTGSPVLWIVAAIYLAMGLRGGIWAIRVLLTDFPHDDLPRYNYRRLLWKREGYRSQTVPMLHEISQQGLANSSILAAPAMLAVADRGADLGPVVIAGAALFVLSWALESLADLQKARFAKRAAASGDTSTCEVGLWRYSRHPNYFFEWHVWHGLILVAVPSLIELSGDFALLPWLGFAVALVSVSGGMYYTLVHATGAVPAEHFSVQHRPDYPDYQRRVNRFFPGPRRAAAPTDIGSS